MPHGEITHADVTHVMGTLVGPVHRADFPYRVGQYVYVHSHAVERNDLDAVECRIEDVTGAPLAIVVCPCNHPEETFTTPQDRLSAPIEV